MTTNITLVNTALDEAKVSLDPLTPATFDDPPRTAMYNRFKRWVNEAYIELLTTRNEWFSRKERGLVEVGPRLVTYDNLIAPAAGFKYRGTESGIEIEVQSIHDNESNLRANIPTRMITIKPLDHDDLFAIPQAETFDLIYPTAMAGAMKVKGWGFYDLVSLVGNAENINPRSMTIMPTDVEYMDTNEWSETPVQFVQWEDLGDIRATAVMRQQGAYTRYVSRSPRGDYYFYPPLTRNVQLAFDYTRSYTDMVGAEDVPVGIPEKYRMWIVWRAVAAYGDFQQNSAIWSRGDRNAEKIMNIMERDLAPEITFARSDW